MKSLSSVFGRLSKRLPQWLQPNTVESSVSNSSSSTKVVFPVTKYTPSELEILKSKQSSELNIKQLEDLANVYYKGVDGHVGKDVSKAVEFWTAAGKLGSTDSVYYRALCYRSGEGVPKDATEAFRELSKIAESHSHGRAHYTLGVMYLKGEGVEVDEKLSFDHFKKAAVGGVLPAYHNLGNAYAEGKGVDKDEAQALQCYEAASKSGDPAAKYTLGTWYYRGRAGLPVDAKRSFELQMEAAKLGHPMATYNVGSAYLLGDGVGKNEKLAAVWLERAVHYNIPAAIMNLGTMYRYGVGVDKDLDRSVQIFSRLRDEQLRMELLEELRIEKAHEPVN